MVVRTVTAAIGNSSVDTTFNVVEPQTAILENNGTSSSTTNPLYILYQAFWYIGPEDVNFANILVFEGITYAQCDGYFSYQQGTQHVPGNNGSRVTTTLLAGKGWLCAGHDNIGGGTQGAPYTDGTFLWAIPWSYQVNGTAKQFTIVNHLKQLDVDTDTLKATLRITKPESQGSVTEL